MELDEVTVVDDTVTVLVDILSFKRIAVSVIYLLVNHEGERRLAYHVVRDVTAGSVGDCLGADHCRRS